MTKEKEGKKKNENKTNQIFSEKKKIEHKCKFS